MAAEGLITKLFTVVCALKKYVHDCIHACLFFGAEVGKQFYGFCYLLLVLLLFHFGA